MKRFWDEGSGHSTICPSMRTLLRLLSAEISMGILAQLAKCAMDVTGMADTIHFDVVATSQCLKAMHSFSMVEVKREKQRHIYSLGRGVKVSLNGQNIYVSARTAEGAKMVLRMPVPRPRSPWRNPRLDHNNR